jgi:hypothetical protein
MDPIKSRLMKKSMHEIVPNLFNNKEEYELPKIREI